MNPVLRNTLHPSEMLPESLRRMPPATEQAEDSPRWNRKAGQSEARQYTSLAKLAKEIIQVSPVSYTTCFQRRNHSTTCPWFG